MKESKLHNIKVPLHCLSHLLQIEQLSGEFGDNQVNYVHNPDRIMF
jgi:hypothetical protein